MAISIHEHMERAWQDFLALRAEMEIFGALREIGKIVAQLDSISPSERAQWRRRLLSIQLSTPEVQDAKARTSDHIAKASMLMDAAGALIDEEVALLLTIAMEVNLVDKFFLWQRNEHISEDISRFTAELEVLRASKKVGERIRTTEAWIYRNLKLSN